MSDDSSAQAAVVPRFDIAPATAADADEIAALVNAAYQPWIARIGQEPLPMLADYRAVVAAGGTTTLRREGAIVAVLVLEPRLDHVMIENVAVHPAWQRRGLGRVMMQLAENAARRFDTKLIRLYTNAAMIENIALYQRLGYVETSRSSVDGRHRVFMEKSIPD